MPNSHPFLLDENADNVEPVRLIRPPVPVDPDEGGPGELALFPPPDGLDGLAELRPSPGLHFHERHEPVALHDQVDVTVPAAEPAHQHPPAFLLQPSLRYSLSQFSERHSLGRHGGKLWRPAKAASSFGLAKGSHLANRRAVQSRGRDAERPIVATARAPRLPDGAALRIHHLLPATPMRITAILLGLLLAGASPAISQTPNAQAGSAAAEKKVDPAKEKSIRKLIELTRATQTMLEGMKVGLEAQKKAQPGIPDVFWEEFLKRSTANIDEFVTILVGVHDRNYTKEQIDEMVAFFETPLGRMMAEKQPAVALETVAAAERWGMKMGMQVMMELTEKGLITP